MLQPLHETSRRNITVAPTLKVLHLISERWLTCLKMIALCSGLLGRAYYIYQGKNHVHLGFASESMEPNPVPGMEWALLEYLLVE